jgi:hypothetical protein
VAQLPAEVTRIVEVLQLSSSCFLPPFQSLNRVLEAERRMAEENIKILGILEEPCGKLERAHPKVRPIRAMNADCPSIPVFVLKPLL